MSLSVTFPLNSAGIVKTESYGGTYDLSDQISRLKQLQKEGKSLHLIIGRGNATKDPMQTTTTNIWVYGDYSGSQMTPNNDLPHLWLNFDNIDHLALIPDSLFSEICIDSSTWKFFANRDADTMAFQRILVPGGRFTCEENYAIYQDCEGPALSTIDDSVMPCWISTNEKAIHNRNQSLVNVFVLKQEHLRSLWERFQAHAMGQTPWLFTQYLQEVEQLSLDNPLYIRCKNIKFFSPQDMLDSAKKKARSITQNRLQSLFSQVEFYENKPYLPAKPHETLSFFTAIK